MLIISLEPGESLLIGTDVVVDVLQIKGEAVEFGVVVPGDLPVHSEDGVVH